MNARKQLLDAFRFFHANAGYCVGRRAVGAYQLAIAEQAFAKRGLMVYWEDDPEPWDGDCERPAHVMLASVWDTEDGFPRRGARCLASLGSIGLNSLNDPYRRVVNAELAIEALDALDADDEAAAIELAARPTYASGG